MNLSHIAIIDFESQYTKLIAKCVRSVNVFCKIYHYTDTIDDNVVGIICSGGKNSVTSDNHPTFDWGKYKHLPILTICYSTQLYVNDNGGLIYNSNKSEFGRTRVLFNKSSLWEDGIGYVWMSHNDSIKIDDTFTILAKTENSIAAFKKENVTGLLFHPEVSHTNIGMEVFNNWLKSTRCNFNWTPENMLENILRYIKNKVKDENVLMAVSGGVDSTTGATLIHKAIGNKLKCVFINNGLLRYNEVNEVLDSYKQIGLNIHFIDATDEFMNNLINISDPKQKRQIIGHTFIDIFSKYAKEQDIKWLGQGTIYSDVIESKHNIKKHHNVGGLPENLSLKLIEPLRNLFKDEVRRLGKLLDIPDNLLYRHPFPGPGLAIRILGDITFDKVKILQKADYIFTSILKETDLYNKIWQAGAILLPVKSVGVMGDCRTYESVIALRAVFSIDGMTASVFAIPHEILTEISTEIINKVEGINRVVYDITTKPPGTIEWE